MSYQDENTLSPVLSSEKLRERSTQVYVMWNWMSLAMHCLWEGREKINVIRLLEQSEAHGSGCTSLRDVFMGNNKKARKPSRVTYFGGYAMKSYELRV